MKVKRFGHLNELGQVVIQIGTGLAKRDVALDVYDDPNELSKFVEEQHKSPVSLSGVLSEDLFAFRKQVFRVEYESSGESEEEAVLRIKKTVYLEDQNLKKLRREVEALEGLLIAEGKVRRTAIPEIVKLIVYERDQGRCVRCNSNQSIQFDHIIPVAKGGSNTEENIQILCQKCNLEKSDKIMF
jgi:hypothetical protein